MKHITIRTLMILASTIFYCGLGYSACNNGPVVFSTIVYDDWGSPSRQLPIGWSYYVPLPANLQNGGYYAQSFIKCITAASTKYCDVVIANRGTTLSIADLYEDFLVMLEITPNYFKNAKGYLDYITKKMVSDGIYNNGVIEVTGHSLGAINAELLFTNIPFYHRALSYIFESPGSRNIIINMENSGELPANALADAQSGILHFMASPNAINTTNEQVGNINNIIFSITSFQHEDFSDIDLENVAAPGYLYYFKDYSITQHKIENFYDYCDQLGFPGEKHNRIPTDRLSQEDWPIGFINSYKYYLGLKNEYTNNDYWDDYMNYAWSNSVKLKKIYSDNKASYEDDFRNTLENSSTIHNLTPKVDSDKKSLINSFNLPPASDRSLDNKSNLSKIVDNNLTGRSEQVREIYNNASIDKKLYYAVLSDDRFYAEKLLRDGKADPNSLHGDKKYNLLQISVQMGYLDMVKLLLKYHANPNLQNINGDTTLHTVAHERYEDSADYAKALVEGGIKTNLKDNNGMTALMIMKKHCPSCATTFSKYAPL